MAKRWQDGWHASGGSPLRKGGSSIVQHVVARDDGRKGALKTLTGDAQSTHERRFRMREEVNALRTLELLVPGVPKLYDTNAGDVGESDPLFLVMEWIPGPTLHERINKARLSIDEIIQCGNALLSTLGVMHLLPLVHRDLKPDNIILRNGEISDPVIIDLGLAWTENRIDNEFVTPRGQELGNRFLRLPEFAPDRAQQDVRSDVTLAAGLLLFMLSGKAPRQLVNEEGNAPHKALLDHIAESVRADSRWVRLIRLFNIAFQTELPLRFQTVDKLREALNNLNAPADATDVLTPAMDRLRANLDSERSRKRRERRKAVGELNSAFDGHLRNLYQPSGLSLPGRYGFQDESLAYSGICLQPPDGGGVVCCIRHAIGIGETELTAEYYIEGQYEHKVAYYRGPLADMDGLKDAMWRNAGVIVAFAIDEFNRRTSV